MQRNISEKRAPRPYNSPVRTARAEKTRDAIADAADALFRESGYEAVTITMIARDAGVAPQTVYAVFKSKQRILLYLLSRAAHLCGRVEYFQYLNKRGSRLTASGEIARACSHRDYYQHLLMTAYGGMEILYPELSAVVRSTREQGRKLLTSYAKKKIEDAGEDIVPQDGRQKKRLDLIWALSDGSLYHTLVVKGGWSRVQFEEALRQLVDFTMKDLVLAKTRCKTEQRATTARQ